MRADNVKEAQHGTQTHVIIIRRACASQYQNPKALLIQAYHLLMAPLCILPPEVDGLGNRLWASAQMCIKARLQRPLEFHRD